MPKVKLYCLHFNECDPKKCTALKLSRHNLLKILKKISRKNSSLILDPFSQKELVYEDRNYILENGLMVLDCSWKHVVNFNEIKINVSRRLPPLIAANPINYGKWEKLSSVEALAAALYITGFQKQTDLILSKFSWGKEFVNINFKK